MATSVIKSDLQVQGLFSCENIVLPDDCVTSAKVEGPIEGDKLECRHKGTYSQASGTTAAAETKCVAIIDAGNGGTLQSFRAGVFAAPSAGGGDDMEVTVDLQRATSGGSLATVLSAAIVIDKTDAAKTPYEAALATTALAEGDQLYVVVSVSGTTGTQATGVFAEVAYDEQPT